MLRSFHLLNIIILTALLLSPVGKAFAHQPQEMTLKYFPDANRLKVEVHHRVKDKYEHYISRIAVQINNDVPIQYYLRGQDSTGLVLKEIKMNVASGKTIHVRAYCNTQGYLESVLHINEKNYYEQGAHYRSGYERPSYRGLERTLFDYHYDRFHDHSDYPHHLKQPKKDTQPEVMQDPVDSPQRRHMELERQIRRRFHRNLEGEL